METALRYKAENEILRAMERWSEHEMEWGTDDCMLAIADIIKNIFGKDPAIEFRGHYKTKLGAYRKMGKDGIKGVAERTAKNMNWRSINPIEANVGDVGLIVILGKKNKINFVAAICRANNWFVARSERGFVGLPAKKVAYAWSII